MGGRVYQIFGRRSAADFRNRENRGRKLPLLARGWSMGTLRRTNGRGTKLGGDKAFCRCGHPVQGQTRRRRRLLGA